MDYRLKIFLTYSFIAMVIILILLFTVLDINETKQENIQKKKRKLKKEKTEQTKRDAIEIMKSSNLNNFKIIDNNEGELIEYFSVENLQKILNEEIECFHENIEYLIENHSYINVFKEPNILLPIMTNYKSCNKYIFKKNK